MSHAFRIAASAAGLLLVGCGNDREVEESPGALVDSPAVAAQIVPPEGPPITIAVSEKDGSMVLTDGSGRTLYVADKPPAGPPGEGGFMPLKGRAQPGDTAVKAELIGVTTLPDGSVQVTYAEEPLYIYTEDQAGQTKGQGKTVSGTTFRAATPSGRSTKR